MVYMLKEPYGYNDRGAVSVRLTVFHEWSRDIVESVLLGHSCHRPAIPKILDCLQHSERYDCWLRSSVAQEIIRAGSLERCGIRFEVIS